MTLNTGTAHRTGTPPANAHIRCISNRLLIDSPIGPTTMPTAVAPTSETERSAADALPQPVRWTRTQYQKLADAAILPPDTSTELIHGHICTMSPQNSRHATTVTLVDAALRHQYDADSFFFRVQLPLALGPHSEPEPDLAIIEGQPRDFTEAHPTTALLVVEVADASLPFDRSTKQALYAAHNISTYWILNLQHACLEVYTDPQPDCYGTKHTFTADESGTLLRIERSVSVGDLLP